MILVVFLRATLAYHQYVMCMLSRKPIPFDQPANYQINVLGQIAPTMSDLLGGLTICKSTVDTNSSATTTLEGELRDQAALAGVLNTIYELHLPLLLVKRLDDSLMEA